MSIVRVGATKKYTDGWEAAFGDSKSGGKKAVAGEREEKQASQKVKKKKKK